MESLLSILSKGCKVRFICKENYEYIGARTGFGRKLKNSIIRFKCQEKMTSANALNAYIHEFQHVTDGCNEDIGKDCFGSICTEIKAYRKAEYSSWPKDAKLKETLRQRVKSSAFEYCKGKKTEEEFNKQFNQEYDKVYDKCID